jgi:hypothetical protein
MVVWHALAVPYAEQDIARSAGADWDRHQRLFYCNATQYRSRAFKRWHDRSRWRRITLHIGSGPAELSAAKLRRCLWDAESKTWFITVTDDCSMSSWHRVRMQPPTEHVLRVNFAEREQAKAAGCRWNPDIKKWVFASHDGTLPSFVLSHMPGPPEAAAGAVCGGAPP